MTQVRKGLIYGSSIAAILSAGIGPRIALAPPDDAGGAGAGGDGAGGAAGAGDGAGGDGGAGGASGDGAQPSALAAGVAKAGETAAAETDAAKAAAQKVEGADKVKPDAAAKPEAKPGDPPVDAVVKDVDGNPLPEKYDIKMPDGMEMDTALMEVAAPIFKDTKMSPAQAQAMTDLYTKVQADALAKHSELVNGWVERSKKDPEIGGANYDENVGKASAAFHSFGDTEALQVLDTYGLGNHPAILRLFARVGKAMGEGATILPGSGTGRVSDAQALYPSMTK